MLATDANCVQSVFLYSCRLTFPRESSLDQLSGLVVQCLAVKALNDSRTLPPGTMGKFRGTISHCYGRDNQWDF